MGVRANRTARRTVAAFVVLTLVACDASKSPSAVAPVGTEPAGATATDDVVTDETVYSGPVPLTEGLYTSQVDPMIATTTLDAAHATSVDVTSDGATLETTGADGTVYSLAIPAGSLPFTVTITMTPIASLTGFSAETTPEHVFGVELVPHGLELALPATLTTTPAVELAPGSALSFDSQGPDAPVGLRYSAQDSGSITMSIDHFSTYFTGTPFPIDDVGATELDKWLRGLGRTAEEELAAEVAFLLGKRQQEEALGQEPGFTTREIARAALTTFRRLVIGRRVAVADQSCANAVSAMSAYLEYQRQRQLLGVGDDPEFDLPDAGLMVPADLVALAEQVCFKEAYERCARTGDLPSLSMYYFVLLLRADTVLGVPPTADSIALAHDYMRRCGRWRLHLTTAMEEHAYYLTTHDTTREFFLQWEPATAEDGSLLPGFGLIGAKIEGHGPVDTLRLSVFSFVCGPRTISGIQNVEEATASIDKLTFDHYEGPTLTGDPLPPVPTRLEITLGFGEVDYVHTGTCPEGDQTPNEDHERFSYSYIVIIQSQGDALDRAQVEAILLGAGEWATIHKGWQFSTDPFKAVQPIDVTFEMSSSCATPCPVTLRLEVILEHEPK